ncbi:hypothetical protein Mgra_00007972 [Meloidogyne graminicola]|uniref:Uncharacterized protein n=1 Tax=Meloidogyne graminicola TaxID=189291 RepID=A0A8S9ZGY2_9BILA|nr:hypothetical protein Mgra_00007972 [Meloidogyne graminicola]
MLQFMNNWKCKTIPTLKKTLIYLIYFFNFSFTRTEKLLCCEYIKSILTEPFLLNLRGIK